MDAVLAHTMAVGLHRGRDPCPDPCPGRDLCRDPDPDRRSGPMCLDLPEALEVLLALPLEWSSTRPLAATARMNPQLMISSFRFSLWRRLGKLSRPQATAHNEDRTGTAQLRTVPIRTVPPNKWKPGSPVTHRCMAGTLFRNVS
jgi:hypothetical protein